MFHAAFARIQVRVAHSDPVVAAGLASLLSREGDIDVLDDRIELPGVARAGRRTDVVIADYARAMALAALRASDDADRATNVVQGRHLDYHWDGAMVDLYRDAGSGDVYRIS